MSQKTQDTLALVMMGVTVLAIIVLFAMCAFGHPLF